MKGRGICIALAALGLAATIPAQAFRLGWRDFYSVTAGNNDRTRDTVVDRSSNVYVVGTSTVGPAGDQLQKAVVSKYNALGTRLWRVMIGASNNTSRPTNGLAIAVDAAGVPYVGMSSPVNSTVPQFALARLNPANGAVVWLRNHNTAVANDAFTIQDMAVDRTGAIVATGGAGVNSRGDFGVVKYTAAGTFLWFRRWKATGGTEGEAFALAIGPNNDAFVVGRMAVPGQGLDSAIVKVRADGVVLWGNRFGGRVGFGTDRALAVTVDRAGDAYVTGDEYIESSSNYLYLRRVNGATGARMWHRSLMLPRNNYSSGVGVGIDPQGNILVGGHAWLVSANRSDLLVMKWSPLGAELWRRSINSGAANDDYASSFAVDQLGNGYIVGTSTPTSGADRTDRIFAARVGTTGAVGWVFNYRPGFAGDGRDVSTSTVYDPITGHLYVSAGASSAPTGDGKALGLFQAPLARPDVYTMNRNTILTTTAANAVVVNDIWRFFTTTTLAVAPSVGTLTLNANGTFTYRPPTNFVGTATFSYRLNRTGLTSSVAQVRVVVR